MAFDIFDMVVWLIRFYDHSVIGIPLLEGVFYSLIHFWFILLMIQKLSSQMTEITLFEGYFLFDDLFLVHFVNDVRTIKSAPEEKLKFGRLEKWLWPFTAPALGGDSSAKCALHICDRRIHPWRPRRKLGENEQAFYFQTMKEISLWYEWSF